MEYHNDTLSRRLLSWLSRKWYNLMIPKKYVFCRGCKDRYKPISYIEVEVNEAGEIIKVAPGALLEPAKYTVTLQDGEHIDVKEPETVICAVCLDDHRVFSFDGAALPDACKNRKKHKMYHVTGAQCPCESK